MDKAGNFEDSDFPLHRDTIYLSCIDEQGNAKAVEKRPPPPPGGGIAEDIGMLLRSPDFLFGTVLSVGSLVLLLLISAADEAA